MPEDLLQWVREQFYCLTTDPYTGRERLFFDNSGGSLRLKSAEEAFHKVDSLPNSYGHGGVTSDYLDSLRVQAVEDMRDLFHAQNGCMVTSMTASIIMFDVSGYIVENTPGKNIVTTELEHPSAFDACLYAGGKADMEVRVAKTDPRTGQVPVENILSLIDQDTCLLSVMLTSNITGAVMDVETVVREARKIKPDLYIVCDSVQHTPHGIFDLEKVPVDAVNFAAYKFGGCRGLGVGWISERVMNLPHRKVLKDPMSNWELGGCASGMYACLSAIFDYVLTVGKYFLPEEKDRHSLYLKGMETLMLHERALLHRMLEGSEQQKGIRAMKGVHVAIEMDHLENYDLILPLTFDNLSATEAFLRYEDKGVTVHDRTDRSHYSDRQVHSIGENGILRVSPFHCHTYEEIDRFLKITEEIINEAEKE